MLPSSQPSDREYVMRRCWRNWLHMTWKLSTHSSPWPINAPEPPSSPRSRGPPRSTHYQKPRSTALVVAAATGGQGDHNKLPRPQRGNSGSCPVHPTVATAPRSVARSLTSRNASVSGASSFLKTTPHLVADLAKKRWTMARWPQLSGILGISRPKGT
jgi:hypothetical protein